MAFTVEVGPPQISIHHGQTVLISEPDGQILWPSDKGLYVLDTRVISSWTIFANGETWELLNGGPVAYYASRIFSDQSHVYNRNRDDRTAHARPHHQPLDRGWPARGS